MAELTLNTEHPDVGVNVNAHVGGGMTQIVLCKSSPPHPLANVCVTVYVPGCVKVTGSDVLPAVHKS